MTRPEPTFNTDNLVSIHEAAVRCSKAVDELEWSGQFDQADILREELRYLEALHDKGDVYVPTY